MKVFIVQEQSRNNIISVHAAREPAEAVILKDQKRIKEQYGERLEYKNAEGRFEIVEMIVE